MGADTPLDDGCTHLHLLLLWLEPHWLLCDVALRPCRCHSAYSEDVQVHEDSIQKGKPFKGLWQNGADVWFALFALVFFVTRLVIYPYVCWSAHIEATKYFAKGAAEWTCVALLEILLVLQCYWFYLLCRAIHRMLILGAVEDVRSDSEDEPENTNGKKHE